MIRPRSRRAQRVRFSHPLTARLQQTEVRLVDLSILGAGIEHDAALAPGARDKLFFHLNGQTVWAHCRVTRSRLVRVSVEAGSLFRSGLEFDRLDVSARVAVAALVRSATVERPPAGFICASLEAGGWRTRWTPESAQPFAGFTVTAEDETQVGLLCEAYERADADGKRLIRLCAALTIADGE